MNEDDIKEVTERLREDLILCLERDNRKLSLINLLTKQDSVIDGLALSFSMRSAFLREWSYLGHGVFDEVNDFYAFIKRKLEYSIKNLKSDLVDLSTTPKAVFDESSIIDIYDKKIPQLDFFIILESELHKAAALLAATAELPRSPNVNEFFLESYRAQPTTRLMPVNVKDKPGSSMFPRFFSSITTVPVDEATKAKISLQETSEELHKRSNPIITPPPPSGNHGSS
jgi:hypothetical protein